MSAAATSPCMVCLGLNHRTAPLAVRERFAVAKGRLQKVTAGLLSLPGVEECVLLSTCNRTEVYFWSHCPENAAARMLQTLSGDAASVPDYFYRHEGRAALTHLARVAGGLDSMVLGETEIFGQLKNAYHAAHAAGATGRYANRTFQHIFTIGKKVRSSTQITSGPTSVGAVAVQLAGEILGGLSGVQVLVVGAGDIARSTAKSLHSRGAEHIFVANRSFDRAVELASHVGGRVIRFADWIPYLRQIDIVIVSTASPAYVVSPPVLEQVLPSRGDRPLFLIDLSVPRNVDPSCDLLPGVHVYDIDSMESMADESRRSRAAEIDHCEEIIRCWVEKNAADLFFSLPVKKISPAVQPRNSFCPQEGVNFPSTEKRENPGREKTGL